MEKIFIWGTGCIATEIMDKANVLFKYDVQGFIDNDENKQGTVFFGKKIYSPDVLADAFFDKLVILTKYYDEICEQICSLYPNKKFSIEDRDYFDRSTLIERYKNSEEKDILEVLEYIKRKPMHVFNYEFVDKYLNMDVDICFDIDCNMYYAVYKEKKMYFSPVYNTKEKAETYYRYILLEQDEKSPHRYLTSEFDVSEGAVVVDVGVAEGNFSLDIIDKAKKIYLIETDEGWVKALKKTFSDYKDKVVIINKFASSLTIGKYATLDSLIYDNVDFLKMDIEGNEWDALCGAKRIITESHAIKCAICSYHRGFDEILIKDILDKYGLKCSTSSGYMWFSGLENDYTNTRSRLSKALVRGIK